MALPPSARVNQDMPPKGGYPSIKCVRVWRVCVWPHESLTLGGEHRREARAIAYERERERERERGAAAAQNGQNIAQKLWSSRAMVPPIAAKHARLCADAPADSGCNCSTPPPKPTPSHLPPPPPPRKPQPLHRVPRVPQILATIAEAGARRGDLWRHRCRNDLRLLPDA